MIAEVLVGYQEAGYSFDQQLDVAEQLYDQAKAQGMWPDEPMMMTMARVHAMRGDFHKVWGGGGYVIKKGNNQRKP